MDKLPMVMKRSEDVEQVAAIGRRILRATFLEAEARAARDALEGERCVGCGAARFETDPLALALAQEQAREGADEDAGGRRYS
jgi:hypothetical protein